MEVSSAAALGARDLRRLMTGLATGTALAALDTTVVGPALPTIATELGGLGRLPWLVSAYLVTATIAIPVFAKLSDVYGRKRLYRIAVIEFLVASLLCGIAGSFWQLLAFRALQGIGGGAAISLTHAIVGDTIAPRERGRYLAFVSTVWGVTTVLGPLVGGLLTDHVSWRAIFLLNLPLCLAVLWVTRAVLPGRQPHSQHRADVLGLTLLGLALAALVLTLVQIDGGRPDLVTMTGAAGTTLVLTAAFVWRERHSPARVFPVEVLTGRTVRVALTGAFLHGAGLFCAVAFFPLYLQTGSGGSATATGLLMLPFMIPLLAVLTWVGRRMSRTGRYRIYPILGSALVAAGFLLLGLGVSARGVLGAVPLVLVGSGLAMVLQVLLIAAQNESDAANIGIVTGSIAFVRQMGAALGTSVLGALYAASLSTALGGGDGAAAAPDLADPRVAGAVADSLHVVWWTMVPLALAVCGVIALRLQEVELRSRVATEPELPA